jgi:hypothetical protein
MPQESIPVSFIENNEIDIIESNYIQPIFKIKEHHSMSFINLNLKTEFEKISHLFVTFFKNEPAWAAVAETDLAFIAPKITSLLTLTTSVGEAAMVANILASVQKDLVLATKFIQAEDNSQNLTDVLNAIVANLQGLLTLGGIKGSQIVNEITSITSEVISEIEIIIEKMPIK